MKLQKSDVDGSACLPALTEPYFNKLNAWPNLNFFKTHIAAVMKNRTDILQLAG